MKKIKFSKNKIEELQSQQSKKISKKNYFTIGLVIFIAVIMILSIFVLGLNNQDTNLQPLEYNGIEFVNKNNLWSFKLNGNEYITETHPIDLESINNKVDFSSLTFDKNIYLIYDTSWYSADGPEVGRLKQILLFKGNTVSVACDREEMCGDFPIISCKDVEKTSVYMKLSNETKIYKDGNCVILEGESGQEVFLINRFAYGLLGVMK